MTTIVKTIRVWNELRERKNLRNKKVGFVPTMGALHQGHQALIERSLEENDVTVVSLFVNPTQFNDKNDLKNYPQSFEKDFDLLKTLNVDILFYPDYKDLYPDNFTYKVTEHAFSKLLCGATRPGHFDGVLTIVLKLLNLIMPDRSYFGEKDFQQYVLIDSMCKAFFVSTEIVLCPTVRDGNGLALSSRNELFTATEREQAARFPKILRSNGNVNEIKHELKAAGFNVDYVEDINNRRYGAVYLGKVRLIDNIPIVHSLHTNEWSVKEIK